MPTNLINNLISKQGLYSLINNLDDGIIVVDNNLTIELFNSAALNILDVNVIPSNTNLIDLFHPVNKNNDPLDLQAIFATVKHRLINQDLILKYNDGSQINLYLSVTLIEHSYSQESTSGFVLIIRDITRQKTIEEEKDEFISVVSHELRTPIAISEGSLSNALILIDRVDDKKIIHETINEAHKQVLYLADLVNDLSIISRSERNVLEIKKDKINVDNLLHELLVNYEPQAREKSLRIVISDNSQKNLQLISTELYVKEILQNFITNAIKYSDKGQIYLSAQKTKTGIEFSVKDEGIGISKADQAKVFDKFFRSEDYKTKKASGTGLGLYVAKQLAHLLQAKISLTSQLNQGSDFKIDFPNL